MATGPDHYLMAEREIEAAEAVMNVDHGWMGSLSSDERLQRRMAYLACAQIHATLAVAAATALGREGGDGRMPANDRTAWFDVAAESRKAAAA